jgi:Ni,Fe-hydrogenase III small subunit/ferredoxin
MLKAILARAHQKHRTVGFPKQPLALPDRFRGRPRIDATRCPEGCRACADVCPTDAITLRGRAIELDLGRCLFCPECERACPEGAIRFTTEYRLAASSRDALMLGEPRELSGHLAQALNEKSRKLFGRSLKLRQVSAGGCNGCEAEVNVLNTVVFDLGRFGIQFVASPRHADGLLITGPVTQNMESALSQTYEAVPAPKLVIAVGACAISGGPYLGHAEQRNGAEAVVPVDLHVPGCPPHPISILDGLLRLLGRLD